VFCSSSEWSCHEDFKIVIQIFILQVWAEISWICFDLIFNFLPKYWFLDDAIKSWYIFNIMCLEPLKNMANSKEWLLVAILPYAVWCIKPLCKEVLYRGKNQIAWRQLNKFKSFLHAKSKQKWSLSLCCLFFGFQTSFFVLTDPSPYLRFIWHHMTQWIVFLTNRLRLYKLM
jgi:hypothetical protein